MAFVFCHLVEVFFSPSIIFTVTFEISWKTIVRLSNDINFKADFFSCFFPPSFVHFLSRLVLTYFTPSVVGFWPPVVPLPCHLPHVSLEWNSKEEVIGFETIFLSCSSDQSRCRFVNGDPEAPGSRFSWLFYLQLEIILCALSHIFSSRDL